MPISDTKTFLSVIGFYNVNVDLYVMSLNAYNNSLAQYLKRGS